MAFLLSISVNFSQNYYLISSKNANAVTLGSTASAKHKYVKSSSLI